MISIRRRRKSSCIRSITHPLPTNSSFTLPYIIRYFILPIAPLLFLLSYFFSYIIIITSNRYLIISFIVKSQYLSYTSLIVYIIIRFINTSIITPIAYLLFFFYFFFNNIISMALNKVTITLFIIIICCFYIITNTKSITNRTNIINTN